MMSVVCDGRKELPSGVSREYSSYCGNYTYDGEKLVTRVDAASDPSRIGSDQLRGVRFEGDRMVLISPPRRTGEIEEHREITGNVSRRSKTAHSIHYREERDSIGRGQLQRRRRKCGPAALGSALTARNG
jgi:hypothetical protein